MRILQVRFKNLNSLVGEWEIDLTHPAFASDGIFAITGPTGAGKTTILDAICLALYGRTPRLNKVTKSGNEIMSRQTGECFAEVTFETQSGRFRCHWSQHRARKKPDGELQAPKHEIADAESGQIFEAKLRGVAAQIETATGMDFDRFTRSMLLAQGGFAAFLQAAPDERAPILEQITGTEIYSQISIRVHERHSDEHKKLDTLQAELAGMQLLTEEDEQKLKASLEQKVVQEADLNQEVVKKNNAIAWLDGIELLEKELGILKKKKLDLLTRQEAFQPELERLERAKQALELAGEYASLASLRREHKTDQQNHNECQQVLPEQEVEVKRAGEVLNLASENLEQKRVEKKEALLVIRKVREQDLKLGGKEAPIKTAGDAILEMEKSLDILRAKNNEDCRVLDEEETALGEVLKHLYESKEDERLIEYLAGIRNRFVALRELDEEHRSKLEELGAAETQKTEALQVWSEQSTSLEAQKKELEAIQGKLSQQQIELKKNLADREISDWRNALSEHKERKALLEKVIASVQSSAKSRHALNKLNNRHEIVTAEKGSLSHRIQEQTEKHASFEREMHLLETQLSLLKKIQDFEEARQQLQDGEPCPLCGAKEHPFAEGNIPVPDETTTTLNRVRADLKQANDILSSFKIKQAETLKDLEQIATQQKEAIDNIAIEDARIHEGLAVLSADASGKDLEEDLQRLQQKNDESLENTTIIVKAVEKHEKEIASLRESFERTRDAVAVSERGTQNAAHKKDSTEQAVNREKKELKVLAAQFQKAQEETLHDVSPYGVKSLTTDALDQIQLELTSRRDQWHTRQKQKTKLERHISTLELQKQHQAGQISKSETELKNQRYVLSTLLRERDSLTHERMELFGDKSPDDEETRLSLAIDEGEKHLDGSRQVFNSTTQELSKLKSSVEAIERTMLARAKQLKIEEEAFNTRLGTFGFTDETSYQAACLPEDERKSLLQQAQQLATEQTEFEARRRDKTTLLETEQQKQVTDQPRDHLKRELDDFLRGLKDLQQEVGGIRQKLNDNEDLRRKQKERVKAIDGQKSECTRWDMLHELIGSADGKKYRNFAQGLTFEMMIGHANRQLQKMTDRYLLIRDDGQPLELDVVDNYQAGEIRSTKNLSGGESFIVSLSLALGLSQMASKNVRVDSLFLDEGFGTLDEEALDTALETLAGLQQEGKLIGVISHVPAPKHRFSTQILISPHAGRRSVISGPGCSRLHLNTEV